MEAMFFAKTTVVNLSKSFSKNPTYLNVRSKVSRVSFTSASSHYQGRQRATNSDDDVTDYASFSTDGTDKRRRAMNEEAIDKASENADQMKKKSSETAESMKQKAGEAAEKAKDKAHEMSEKAKETYEAMSEKASDVKDKTKQGVVDMKEKTKETGREAKEKTKAAGETVVERVESIGEKAKETMKGAWDKAKETTEKIKETVVGKSEDVDDLVEDHVTKPIRETKEKVDYESRQSKDEQQDQNKY